MNTKPKKRSPPHLLARSAIILGMLWQGAAMGAQPLLAAGLRHSIYVNEQGRLAIWGDNTLGQLGQEYESVQSSATSYNPMGLRRVRVLGSGWSHILAATRPTYTRNPTLWAWAYGDVGQLGTGPIFPMGYFTNFQARQIFPVFGDFSSNKFIMLQGGIAHSLALTGDGAVWSWGWNQAGQLGLGDVNNRWTAYRVKALPDSIVAIAAGGDFSLALAQNGSLWSWGNNTAAQLGLGSRGESPVLLPQRLPQSEVMDIRAIAAGTAFAMALDDKGTVYSWGANGSGQLGRLDPLAFSPDVVHGLPPIASIAAGGEFAMAVDREGTLWAWGNNGRGQLADGTTISRSTPKAVLGLPPVRLMAAGVEHALVLGLNGVLLAWGDDSAEQLGENLAGGLSTVPQVVTMPKP